MTIQLFNQNTKNVNLIKVNQKSSLSISLIQTKKKNRIALTNIMNVLCKMLVQNPRRSKAASQVKTPTKANFTPSIVNGFYLLSNKGRKIMKRLNRRS